MADFENFCTLCNVNLESEDVSVAHFNGQMHQKKLTNPSPVVLKCDICNISCTGEIPFEAHMKSKKHSNKVAAANTASGVDQSTEEDDGPLNCDVCGKSFSGRKPANDHFSSESHKKKAIVFEEIKNGEITPLHCEPCLIKCADEDQLTVHLASMGHKKKVDGKFKKPKIKSEDGEDDGALQNSDNDKSEESATQNGQKPKKKLGKPPAPLLNCEVCNVSCTGSIPFEAHLKSKQHLKKSTQVAEKNDTSSDGLTEPTASNVNDHFDDSADSHIKNKSSNIAQENNESMHEQDDVGGGRENESPDKSKEDNSIDENPKKAKRGKKVSLSCEFCPAKGLDEKQMAVHILDHKKELQDKKSQPKEVTPVRSLRKRKSDSGGATIDDKVIKMDE